MAKGIDLKLDKAWSEYVKLRAGNKCEVCRKKTHLNSHHIFGRRNRSVRWEITNGISLCCSHHTFSSTFSAHQAPLQFISWLIEQRGENWYNELVLMANTPKKWKITEKEELLIALTEGVKNENQV